MIEVLVVVAIIALIITILIPSLSRAREQATSVACQANIHQLALGLATYVSDTKALPGTNQVFWEAWDAASRPSASTTYPDWKPADSWLGLCNTTNLPPAQDDATRKVIWKFMDDCDHPSLSADDGLYKNAVPNRGSLFRYTKNEDAYICPKDKQGAPDPRDPKGGGGNGRFSYTLNGILGFKNPEKLASFGYVANFTPVQNIVPITWSTLPAGTRVKWSSSKFITFVEEHPFNNTNQSWPVDGWEPGSYFALRHFPDRRQGRVNFAFLDGHVEPRRYPFDMNTPTGLKTLLGVDILNEYRFPYDWANPGGAANEVAFLHKFTYPYQD